MTGPLTNRRELGIHGDQCPRGSRKMRHAARRPGGLGGDGPLRAGWQIPDALPGEHASALAFTTGRVPTSAGLRILLAGPLKNKAASPGPSQAARSYKRDTGSRAPTSPWGGSLKLTPNKGGWLAKCTTRRPHASHPPRTRRALENLPWGIPKVPKSHTVGAVQAPLHG